MARERDKLAENVDGDFFVDTSCIDCDLCRQLAPATFARIRSQSYVARQPRDDAERERALVALVTCPTSSIGTTRKLDTRAAMTALPEPIADDVYFVGWASEDSYGAASWLIRRPQGNVLVDSPRAASALVRRLEQLGGVATMMLTHIDDVADHRAFHDHFGCARIIHRADARGELRECEQIVDGSEPIALAGDLAIVPVPGHTRGSCALVYRNTFAFTGDHVWGNDDGTALESGEDVCWYSWPEQKRSMLRLAKCEFTWILPGHGRRFHAPSVAAMRAALTDLSRS
jgi:glyoxylase-like metal-dependent hydrolase (beta-lactamase superfamily II)